MAPSKTEETFGKSILFRPSVDLRLKLEDEAAEQKRSLGNLVIVILERYFKSQDGH